MRDEEQTVDVEEQVPDVDVAAIGGPLSKLKALPDAAEHFKRMEALLPALRAASIKLTRPQDWVVMGDSCYFQGIGSERITGLWALALGEPRVEREDYADGTFSYIIVGPCASRRTGVIYAGIEGGRWSGEQFFERYSEPRPRRDAWDKMSPEERQAWLVTHRLPPSPLAVRKAAVTNWQGRCITMLTGLRGLTVADLAEYGLRPAKAVQFQGGAHGGKVSVTDAQGDLLVPVGSKKGTRVKDLPDAEVSSLLAWYQKQVEDPAKKRYKAENEAWIGHLESEVERRSRQEAP